MGRVPRNRLPHLKQSDDAYKQRLKEYADRRRRVEELHFQRVFEYKPLVKNLSIKCI